MEFFLMVFWYGASGFVSLVFLALSAGILRWTVRELTGRNAREQERKELMAKYHNEVPLYSGGEMNNDGGERNSIEKTPTRERMP